MDNIKFVKFFNSLLKPENNNKKEEEYVDLDNYIFRWKYFLDNIELKIEDDEYLTKNDVEELDGFLKRFFDEVRNESKLNDYLKEKKREHKDLKLKLNSSKTECIVIKDSQNDDKVQIDVKKSLIIEEIVEEPKINEETVEKTMKYVQEFVKIEGANDKLIEDKIKELLIIVISNKNPQFLNSFCTLLAENLLGTDSDRFESKLIILANVLSNLNSTSSSLITYTKLIAILKNLFSNYIILSNRNKTTNQVETFALSKKMQTMCSNLFKSFPSQFTEACFIEWIKILVIDCKLKNKTNIEFLLKVLKDLFNEPEALILLNFFIRQNLDNSWNEDYYIFLNNIFDKILKLNPTDIQLILTKMKSDCKLFCKSLPFAKFLSTIINRLKNISNFDDQTLPQDYNNMSENQYFECSKPDILLIIEQNQTLMKKKLLMMVN
jgi:hypothetical protein